MAVYKRTYRGYTGVITPAWSRFMVVYRVSSQGLFRSKFLAAFLMACFFCPIVAAGAIYVANNPTFLATVHIPKNNLMSINGQFFSYFLQIQASFAIILTALVGPGLVSPDLGNNALPLYFCRPFSRTEYVLGKMSVLAVVLSWITMLPALALFGIQTSVAGGKWFSDNYWIAGAIVLGSAVLILTLTLLSLALSAWVKWKVVAGALVLAVLFGGAGFGHAVDSVMRTDKGAFLDLIRLVVTVFRQLFGDESESGIANSQAWMGLFAAWALCFYLLTKKLRAYEVVK
jgi:ABC-2 type transport system permease protein